MINTFKLNPTLDPKKKTQNKHQHHHEQDHEQEGRFTAELDNFESEEERESREYTNFSMYNTDDHGMEVRKSDMKLYERSESVVSSQKKVFQHSVHKVMKLQALIQKLKSFNSQLVKATLIEMVPLINSPETAVILKDAGLCPLLLELLKFDPLSHWSIVGLSLQALLSIVSVPECALTVISLPNFSSTIETFLKSDKALTQIIAGRIVHRCFVQPIQNEWVVLHDKNLLNLLFKAIELPYKDVQMSLLGLLEDLTYHCDNTLQLCTFAESIEIDFIQLIVDIILAEGNHDIRCVIVRHILFVYARVYLHCMLYTYLLV
jgi:hypothetical protein